MSPYRSPDTNTLSGYDLDSKSTSQIQDTSLPSASLLFRSRYIPPASDAWETNDSARSSPTGFLTRRRQIDFEPIGIFSIRPKAGLTFSIAFAHLTKESDGSPHISPRETQAATAATEL